MASVRDAERLANFSVISLVLNRDCSSLRESPDTLSGKLLIAIRFI